MQDRIDPLEVFNVSHEVVSREDVVITLAFEPECSFVPDNYEFDTTVTIFEARVNVLFLLITVGAHIFTLTKLKYRTYIIYYKTITIPVQKYKYFLILSIFINEYYSVT